MECAEFYNKDGTFSHWSVIYQTDDGEWECATCVMHDSLETCEQELEELK